jgi:hypothetical protein
LRRAASCDAADTGGFAGWRLVEATPSRVVSAWVPRFDRWKPGTTAPTIEVTPGDLADVNETLEQLRRASIQVGALNFALVYALMGPSPISGFDSVEQLLPEITGEFTVLADGSWRIHGANEDA